MLPRHPQRLTNGVRLRGFAGKCFDGRCEKEGTRFLTTPPEPQGDEAESLENVQIQDLSLVGAVVDLG